MKTKFTPGPWTWQMVEDQAGSLCNESIVQHVADCTFGLDGETGEFDEMHAANRALIAAAPDLYAALENAIKSMKWVAQMLEIGPISTFAENISSAHTALKKARGE